MPIACIAYTLGFLKCRVVLSHSAEPPIILKVLKSVQDQQKYPTLSDLSNEPFIGFQSTLPLHQQTFSSSLIGCYIEVHWNSLHNILLHQPIHAFSDYWRILLMQIPESLRYVLTANHVPLRRMIKNIYVYNIYIHVRLYTHIHNIHDSSPLDYVDTFARNQIHPRIVEK